MNQQTLITLNNNIASLKKNANSSGTVTHSLNEVDDPVCLSAISPLAYLADLLDYAIKHIKKEGVALTLADLETYFHQPFGQIPLSCDAVEADVAQIRICVEVLRQHFKDQSPSNYFATTEIQYLNESYRNVLFKIGTSPTELQEMLGLDADEQEEKKTQIAGKLGIDASQVANLWKGDEELTEAWLAEIFGLKKTQEAVFTHTEVSFLSWQKELIQTRADDLFEDDDFAAKAEWLQEHCQQAEKNYRKVITETEEFSLPILRQAYVTSAAQARTLSNELLVSCEYDACFRTTRVSQAITTIQQLITAVRTGLLKDTHPELTLHTTDFSEEWKWLGTYKSWRAAMMVFLYPENILDPSLRRQNSPMLEDTIKNLRRARNLSKDKVDILVREYQTYFEDVCKLQVEASCSTAYSDDIENSILFQFGRVDGKVYFSTYANKEQGFWEQILVLEDYSVVDVIGANAFKNSEGNRSIYLFLGIKESIEFYNPKKSGGPISDGGDYDPGPIGSNNSGSAPHISYPKVLIVKYNLKSKEWEKEKVDFNLPQAIHQKVLLERRIDEYQSPRIYIQYRRSNDTIVFESNFLDEVGSALSPEQWQGRSLDESAGEILLDAIRIGKTRLVFVGREMTLDRQNSVKGVHIWNPEYNDSRKSPDTSVFLEGNFYSVSLVSRDTGLCILKKINNDFIGITVKLNPDANNGNQFYPDPREEALSVLSIGSDFDYFMAQDGLVAEPGGVPINNLPNSLDGPTHYGFRTIYQKTVNQIKSVEHAFFYQKDNELKIARVSKVIPEKVSEFILIPPPSIQRKQNIIEAFESNTDSGFCLNYLWEAYYFLPKYAALQLQRSHQSIPAKDYYKLIYDYSVSIEERKIFYGLVEEETQNDNYVRNNQWLLDPLNPHVIARTRQNNYTEYTILSIVRCLIQEADQAFTVDTIEQVAKARNLYLAALELLELIDSSDLPVQPAIAKNVAPKKRTIADVLEKRNELFLNSSESDKASNKNISIRSSLIGNILLNINSFEFSIPENPVWQLLKLHAEVSLFKINTCRNIAGDERPTDSLAIMSPDIRNSVDAVNGSIYLDISTIAFRSTPFRYPVLIERAKQITNIAQQIEASFLSALEKFDAEQLNLINAKNDLQLSKMGIRLQDLRLKEAANGVILSVLQTQRAEIQRNHYQGLLNEGLSGWEIGGLIAQTSAVVSSGAALVAGIIKTIATNGKSWGDMASSAATHSSYIAGLLQKQASYERRKQDWNIQRNLSNQDVAIGYQQQSTAKDHVKVVNQERSIAALRSDQAETVAEFLSNKFTNAELYDWMSEVLEDVYSFFLQQATATAQLAAQQLAFERQEPIPSIILADYWEAPENNFTSLSSRENEKQLDRKGLTGSARLLQDVYQLDQFALQTDRRKLQLTKTISLANFSAIEFQKLRETGNLPFYTPMELFDRDFPGHYLRLIKRIRVSVIALASPIDGIKATLWSNGISRTVQSINNIFTTTEIKRVPENIALTGGLNASGVFDFDADPSKLLPFESMGVDNAWEFQLPKASNLSLDYNAIADVLITIDYTALYSDLYRQQVIEQLGETFMADRVYSFRNEFPDQWYDLHHPELVEEAKQLTVHFDLLRADFPPNVMDLKVKHITLYLPQDDYPNLAISLNREGKSYPYQNKMTPNGIASSRQTDNFPGRWDNMLGASPEGQWTLSFPNNETVRQWFKADRFKDILIVITYEGDFA